MHTSVLPSVIMVAHTCYSRTQEVWGRRLRVLDQPGLYVETIKEERRKRGRKGRKKRGKEGLRPLDSSEDKDTCH